MKERGGIERAVEQATTTAASWGGHGEAKLGLHAHGRRGKGKGAGLGRQ
jgi:hypothetical protein